MRKRTKSLEDAENGHVESAVSGRSCDVLVTVALGGLRSHAVD